MKADYKIFGSERSVQSALQGFVFFLFDLFGLVSFSVMYAHIHYVEEYSCCPLNHVRPEIKVCSLQLP